MAELKTQENNASVEDFLNNIEDPQQREDAKIVCRLMAQLSGEKPKMWGTSIVGFGKRHMKYESGRELEWMKIGFAPRKQNLTLYIMEGFDNHAEALKKLGKHSTGKGCLYIKRLNDIDISVLEAMIHQSLKRFS